MTVTHLVYIEDQYGQNWRIEDNDPLWQEAKTAVDTAPDGKVMWSLEKLSKNKGYGWWTTFKKLDEIEADLEKIMPNPGKGLLIDINHEYTPLELRDLLQRFGAFLSTLNHTEGLIEAQCHTLKEGFKTGLSVAMSTRESKETSISGREAEVLASSDLLKTNRRMQIDNEATLLLIQGWRKAYEAAYQTASRLVTLFIGESQMTSDRYN